MSDQEDHPAAEEPGPGPGDQPSDSADTDPTAADIDSQFASIIALWDQEGSAAPLDERRPDPQTHEVLPNRPTLPGLPLTETDDDRFIGWRGYAPPEDDEHFDPPAPTLPPAHDATYWLAVLGICLGPLVIVWAAVLSHNPDPGWWVLFGLAVTVAGFALMVLRGPGDRDPDDNGARV